MLQAGERLGRAIVACVAYEISSRQERLARLLERWTHASADEVHRRRCRIVELALGKTLLLKRYSVVEPVMVVLAQARLIVPSTSGDCCDGGCRPVSLHRLCHSLLLLAFLVICSSNLPVEVHVAAADGIPIFVCALMNAATGCRVSSLPLGSELTVLVAEIAGTTNGHKLMLAPRVHTVLLQGPVGLLLMWS